MNQPTLLVARYQPGGPVLVTDFLETPGDVFFVGNVAVSGGVVGVDSTGYGRSPFQPFATIAYALTQCTADKGDRIYLLPNHNEGFANAQLTINVAGVSIVGLGENARRPRIDFDHANASIDITASNVTIKNLTLLPSVTVVGILIDINTTVTGTILDGIEILPGEDGAGVDEAVIGIDLKVACNQTIIRNCIAKCHASVSGAGAVVSLSGASEDILIENCDFRIVGAAAVAPISGITTLSKNVTIRNCTLWTDDEPGIELLTGTTGRIEYCRIFSNLATINAAIVADGCASFFNGYVEVGGESQAYIGTASVDD